MRKKILIADDEDSIRELVRVTLEEEGYEIHEAVDGVEALAKVEAVVPDLVILDILMPGKVGYIVCREIKSSEETKHIHVLCLSSRSNVGAIETMKMFGADDFLAKPFEPRSLREKVKQALRRA